MFSDLELGPVQLRAPLSVNEEEEVDHERDEDPQEEAADAQVMSRHHTAYSARGNRRPSSPCDGSVGSPWRGSMTVSSVGLEFFADEIISESR